MTWGGSPTDRRATINGHALRVHRSKFRRGNLGARPGGGPWVASIDGLCIYDEDHRGVPIDHFEDPVQAAKFCEARALAMRPLA